MVISPLPTALAVAAQAPKSGGLPVPPWPAGKWEYCHISLRALLRRRGKAACGSVSTTVRFCSLSTASHLATQYCRTMVNTRNLLEKFKWAIRARQVVAFTLWLQSVCGGISRRPLGSRKLRLQAFDERAMSSAPDASFHGLINKYVSMAIISQAPFLSPVLMCWYFVSHRVRKESGDTKPFLPSLK